MAVELGVVNPDDAINALYAAGGRKLYNEHFALWLIQGRGDAWKMTGIVAAEAFNGGLMACPDTKEEHVAHPDDYYPLKAMQSRRRRTSGWVKAGSEQDRQMMNRISRTT